ncbi:MAG: DUF2784 domain-containing protein [Halioglobus sp.]|nr:DUF2784 domain-containing protein [Halioglobus sp.]
MTWLLAADAILVLHFAFVAFVVLALVCIYLGGWRRWRWVGNRRFRLLHLTGVAVVVGQSWLGVICPLTYLENALRERAGELTYAGAFVAHWLERLLYYRAPQWVFILLYTAFGILVLVSWRVVPPRPRCPD